MPEQLKIIIDADVNSAIAGVKELSKVISLDFAKATASAANAATKLSSDVAASVQKINASLSGLKVTSLDVAVNTSSIDASIKSIQSKFAALVDPELNVFANTVQAEAKIKELVADLATLKGSEIFIRANDVQALQKINEIEAELNSLVGKQINLTVTADFTKIEELKTKIASLKVTPVDISVNTSGIDASIKNIQTKFNALIDPQINVLANTELAEAKIKELLGDLSTLKGSEIFIRANDAQALKVINEVEAELNSLVDKQIRLNVNTSEATQKISLLEKELLSLQTLSVAPNVSSTQLTLFEANIKRIKSEIASLKGQGVVIPIEANTVQAQRNINLLSDTIETLRGKAEARKFFITTETDITKIAAYNKEIQKLEDEVRRLQNIGKKGFELFIVPNQTINSVKSLTNSVAAFGGGVKTYIPPAIAGFNKLPGSISPVITQLKALEKQSATTGSGMNNAFGKAFQGLRGLAALIPGIGLGGLIGIAATAVNSLTNGFFEAAFGASKLDKAIDAASESVDKNAASVFAMVKALQSGTLTSSEFKKVKAELIAQAPDFQKSFDGDKISIEASDKALDNYIKQLVKTIKVTAALGVVNDAIAKSIKTILKGGETTFGQDIKNFFLSLVPVAGIVEKAKDETNSLNKALEDLKPGNVGKLLEDTLKKLGLTFSDISGNIDDKALKDKLAKIKADFEKFQNETIAKAQQFKKQFGDTFVLPELETSFFVSKDQVFKNALKVLSDVKKDLSKQAAISALQIKLPVLVTTETKLNADDLKKFLRGQITRDQVREFKVTVPIVTDLDIQLAESLAKEFEPTKDLIDNFFKGVGLEIGVPVTVTPDFTLAKGNIDAIDKLFEVRKQLEQQFAALGDLGTKAFSKISFLHINEGIAEATKKLQQMMEVANTLNQSIGNGLANAFDNVFDAVLEGKNVFKALGESVKALVVDTIKAIARMLILKAVTAAFFPGGAAARGLGGLIGGAIGGSANFGSSTGIGGSAFSNVIQIAGDARIAGSDIVISYRRTTASDGRSG